MRFDFDFGKVTYAPGAPKGLPRWVWRCACGKCNGNLAGPFKTFREAEKDAERWALEIAASAESTHH
jgi:hypothetical protein